MKAKPHTLRFALIALSIVALSGCSDSTDPVLDPGESALPENTFVVDATAGGRLEAQNNPYVYVDITSGTITAAINDDNAADVTNKDNWHIAFKRARPIKLNGGVSGAGAVAGALAVTSAMYDAAGEIATDYANLTAESEFDKFNNLTLAQAKALDYTEDSFGQAVQSNDWAVYDPTTHTVNVTNKWWIVRGGNSSYVKMRVTEYNSPNVTIEYYFAADKDTDYPTTNPQTYTTSLTSAEGSECIDFDTAAKIVSCDIDNHASGEWDLLWEKSSATRTRILWTNGGVKGTGSGGALAARDNLSDFDSYAKATDFTLSSGGVMNIHVTTDSAGGIFSSQGVGAKYGWGEYSLAGNNKLWPNFRVWTLRTGTEESNYKYYKMQIISFYNSTGDSGHFTFRAKEITE